MTPKNLKPKTIKLLKSLKIMKMQVFFEHGKAPHRNPAAGALNESSRSLIWSFWEQKVLLEICEKCQKYQNWINVGYIPDGPTKLYKFDKTFENFGCLS